MAITLRQIDEAVASHFGLTRFDLHTGSRERIYSRPRQIAMHLARELTSASLPAIGKHFQLDHTTVLHGDRNIRKICASNRWPEVGVSVVAIKSSLAMSEERFRTHCRQQREVAEVLAAALNGTVRYAEAM